MLCSTFQSFILCLIVVSSINLAVDSPLLSPATLQKRVIDGLDDVLVVIFTAEMAVKIFVMGLVGCDGAYLDDSWNQLDGAIVVTSLIPKMLGSSGGILGTFRVLRAFRPLRIAARYEELRIVLTALGRSVPAMVNVFGVLLFFWLIFGILSVQLFGGKFYDCAGLDADTYAALRRLARESGDAAGSCAALGGAWANPDFHFDDILSALKALFVISTLEGWHTIMYHAVDATEIDDLPQKDATKMSALFFIVFILVGSFFLISLFVGIIFDNFVKLRDEATGVGMLTAEQKCWVNLQSKIIAARPMALPLPPSLLRYKHTHALTKLLHNIDLSQRRDEDRNLRGWCYAVGISTGFEKLMMLCICLNILAMCFKFEGEPHSYTLLFEVVNTVFTFVFVAEALVKLAGFGVVQYCILHQCEIIVHDDNKLNFTEVLYSLCERIDGCWLNEESKVYHKINKQLARKFDLFGENQPSLGVLLAVTKAQRIWREKVAAKRKLHKQELEAQEHEAERTSKLFQYMAQRRDSGATSLQPPLPGKDHFQFVEQETKIEIESVDDDDEITMRLNGSNLSADAKEDVQAHSAWTVPTAPAKPASMAKFQSPRKRRLRNPDADADADAGLE